MKFYLQLVPRWIAYFSLSSPLSDSLTIPFLFRSFQYELDYLLFILSTIFSGIKFHLHLIFRLYLLLTSWAWHCLSLVHQILLFSFQALSYSLSIVIPDAQSPFPLTRCIFQRTISHLLLFQRALLFFSVSMVRASSNFKHRSTRKLFPPLK